MSRSVDWSLISQTDVRQISHIDLHQRLDACLNRLPDGSGKSDGLGGSGGSGGSGEQKLSSGPDAGTAPDRPAAILVPLLRDAGDWHVLMTKRAAHLAHHAGQISFPGGKVEPEDDGPVAAALREAFEEVRLVPQSVRIVGGLDPVRSPAGFVVQPVVGIVGGDNGLAGLIADPGEVDLIFTLPLSHIVNPNKFRLVPRETNGRRNDYWIVEHDDHLIWGLSARVLNDLHRRIGAAV